VVLSREQRLALEHLSEDTARTPDIYLHIVLLPREHNLGCPVVSCGNVTGHLWVLYTSETEVADLEITVLIYENIARLQIAVNDTGGVDVFQATLCKLV
jgi:GAF domain-containing protein